jgi:hypothetical protein
MINLNKKDAVADAVKDLLKQEEIDANDRTKDVIGGTVKTKRKDDVGPGADGKSSKVRLKSEEVEQIDELSKSTLSKYVKRAGYESGQHGFKAGVGHANDEKETYKKHAAIFNKRQAGIGSAVSRLAKEEAEQIDELSKDTLNNYVKKASPAAVDAMAKSHTHGVLAAQSKSTGSTRLATVNQRASDKAQATANKRVGGVIKATERLYKEGIEKKLASTSPEAGVIKTRGPVSLKALKAKLEENSIYDELINEVLSKDADAGTWIKDFINSDDPKFAGKSKEQRKKQALAAYYAKQRNEEVEQIDELSKDTLKSYAKKAGAEATGVKGKHLSPEKSNMRFAGHKKAVERLAKEEVESIEEAGIVDTIKKGVKAVGKALSHGSDEDMRKDLQKKMGAAPHQQNGKKSMAKYNEEAEQIDEISNAVLDPYKEKAAAAASTAHQAGDHAKGLKRTIGAMTAVRKSAVNTMKSNWAKRDATVKEGWDDMIKDVKSKNEPKPQGGSGVKKGSRYGGSKQAEKPEHDEKKVNEGKDPNMDAGVGSQPDFATNDSKPMKVAKTLAKKTMIRMKSEMLGKAPGNN